MPYARKTHSGTEVPRPLSNLQIDVLRSGAAASGLGGIDWRVNGKQCSSSVYGLRRRRLITAEPVEVDGKMVLKTANTPAGNEALAEIERKK